MEVIIQSTPEQSSRLAASYVAKTIRLKPRAVLGLATGDTPAMLYAELARKHKDEGLDFDQVVTFNLDEYIGLSPEHPCSYHYFMNQKLFNHINVKRHSIHVPNGLADNVPAECLRYESDIVESGGIDLQILGIGGDGHIGFNEPTSSFGSRTRNKTLTMQTRKDNARFFDSIDEVPTECITMGIGTILESRLILFLAFGERKADIVAQAIEGPLTSMVPASVLQLHPDVKIFLDEASASKLKYKDYFKWSHDNKPEWEKFIEY